MEMNAGTPFCHPNISGVYFLQSGVKLYVIPPEIVRHRLDPGFHFGVTCSPASYVGMPQGSEEHIVAIGGSGSGKSSGIAMPTLRTWGGAICATDVKGELSKCYEELYQKGLVTRQYIIFDPMDAESPSYDPFDGLLQDDEANWENDIWDIVRTIHPDVPNDHQPFWADAERGVLAAALYYYCKRGLGFSETITAIVTEHLSTLCEDMLKNSDAHIKSFLGDPAKLKPEILANIDRGLRNKLMLFATDRYISHAFRGKREGAVCFSWKDLDKYNIFLRIPEDKIEQWGRAVNLMYTQLIRHLERRPEMHSEEGKNNVQTLLLMDEFARFGKLEMITDAMATLRSKNVNICLMIQSVAQLDKIYGVDERRIILDNCGYLAILRANDPDTQKKLCEMIGTRKSIKHSVGENFDKEGNTTGYSKQMSEDRDWVVQPHELRTLADVLLLTPYGSFGVGRFRMDNEKRRARLFATPGLIRIKGTVDMATHPARTIPDIVKRNEGAKILSLEERSANVKRRIEAAEQRQDAGIDKEPYEDSPNEDESHKQEVHEDEFCEDEHYEEPQAEKTQEDERSYRNRIIGELVSKYFSEVRWCKLEPDDEDRIRLEAFLYELSVDPDLVDRLQEQAEQLVSEDPDGGWREPV